MLRRNAISITCTKILPALSFGLAVMLSITGCASTGKTVDKAMSAMGLSKKESPDDAKVELPLHIFAGSNLNAGSGDKPLALVVKIYQLRSAQRFQQTPFDSFLDADKERQALGDDLVGSREMLVLPAQRYDMVEKLSGDVPYVGVVALFRSPAARRWRYVYDTNASMPAGITLGAHACALSSTGGKLITDLADDPASLASARCPD